MAPTLANPFYFYLNLRQHTLGGGKDKKVFVFRNEVHKNFPEIEHFDWDIKCILFLNPED